MKSSLRKRLLWVAVPAATVALIAAPGCSDPPSGNAGGDGGSSSSGGSASSGGSSSGGATTGGASAVGGSSSTGGDGGNSARCDGKTLSGIVACVDRERLEADVALIAKPREHGSAHWQTVQDLCAERFEAYGYAVELHDYGSGVNVIARKAGSNASLGAFVVSAHYDSVSECSGADDNASGVAGTLEIARVFEDASFEHDLIFACWDQEESGLLGSKAYVAREKGEGAKFELAISLEMIGFASTVANSQTIPTGFGDLFPDQVGAVEENDLRGDFIAFVPNQVAATVTSPLHQAATLLDLPAQTFVVPTALQNTSTLNDLRRSDHASFWAEGYPAAMITDTANFRNPNYHCDEADDAPGDLDFGFMTKVTASVARGVAEGAGLE